jgi:hypothetical protein
LLRDARQQHADDIAAWDRRLGARRFRPTQERLWLELYLPMALSPLGMLAYFWWRGGLEGWAEHRVAIVVACLAMPLLIALRWFWTRRYRGELMICADGMGIATRSRFAELPWAQVTRIYVLGSDLHVETVRRQRYQLSFEGHDDHKKELVQQLRDTGRTLNLGWAESLVDAIDWLR